MYIIIGLGNPKREYKNTRHNIGFDTIELLSDKYNINIGCDRHKALCGKGSIEGEKVILAMPQTYMNLSGESAREIVEYYKIDSSSQLIVIYDDVSLDLGQIRVRPKGTDGGHNGLKSIIAQLGTNQFMRVRIGVGEKPKGYDLADYVLGHFSKTERETIDEAIINATEAVRCILTSGIEEAMNIFNKKKKEE